MRAFLSLALLGSMLVTFVPESNAATFSTALAQAAPAEMLTADQAARKAREQYGGRVLSVRLEEPQGQSPFYRVKLISDGNVRVVEIPAER